MICHIARGEEWEAAQEEEAGGEYKPAQLEEDGFIHCSMPKQVEQVANEPFTGGEGLVLLWIAASLAHLEWQGRKINLIDTPGDSGFQADTIASLRVVEGALVVVSGVMGVEVNTSRVWNRAEALGLSRVVFVDMLDRERADFFRTLAALQEQLSTRCVAIELPIGAEHELTGIVDLLHNCAYMDPGGAREGDPVPIPGTMSEQAAEYREKLLDAVVETDEELMERYLGGEELDPEAVA